MQLISCHRNSDRIESQMRRLTIGTRTFDGCGDRRNMVPSPVMTLLRHFTCSLAIAMAPLTASADDTPGPICVPLEQKTAINRDSEFPLYPFVRPIIFQTSTKRDRINVLLERLPCEEFCRGVISIVDPNEQINIEAEFVKTAFFDVSYGRGSSGEFVENNEKLKVTRIGYFKRSDGKYIYIRTIRRINPDQNWNQREVKSEFYRTDYQIVDSIQHSGASFCLSGKHPL